MRYQMVLTFGNGNKRRIVETQETAETYQEAQVNARFCAHIVAPGPDWTLIHISHDPDRDVES